MDILKFTITAKAAPADLARILREIALDIEESGADSEWTLHSSERNVVGRGELSGLKPRHVVARLPRGRIDSVCVMLVALMGVAGIGAALL
jgi:hypothetical protein